MIRSCPPSWILIDGGQPDDDGFAAQFHRHGLQFLIVASWGKGWDHVSVSLVNRCPTWDEMCHVKDLMFEPQECAVQYHPAQSQYVNCHPYCLHLWRAQSEAVAIPPTWMIGPGD